MANNASGTQTVFYDPTKTFDDNFDNGPFPDVGQPADDVKAPGQYTFLGHSVNSPFGIPAGPLPSSKHVAEAFKRGFDIVCYKTQRSVAFPCNDFPNVVYLNVDGDLTLEKAALPLVGSMTTDASPDKLTITNSFGNPSRGPTFWVEDMKKAVKAAAPGQLLIASVVGTIKEGFGPNDYYGDFAEAAELAVTSGVPVIELNLSCPNVASEGVICYNQEAVTAICQKTKERIGDIPLIGKFGYFSADQQDLLEKIVLSSSPYLSAYSAINTIAAPVVDEEGHQLLPGEGRLKSGCCGAGIKWAGLDMVKRLNDLRDKHSLNYEIIGVGGVMSQADFHDYLEAGADAVQSATGAMWNPGLAKQIKASL